MDDDPTRMNVRPLASPRRWRCRFVAGRAADASRRSRKAYLQYLTGSGTRAYPVVHLTWAVIGISLAVIAIIAALVLVASLKRNAPPRRGQDGKLPVVREAGGLRLDLHRHGRVHGGAARRVALDDGDAVGRRQAARAARADHRGARAPVVVGGALRQRPTLQDVQDRGRHPHPGRASRSLVNLVGDDVIHSFWVPALSGKMDTIPGQTNTLWIEADKPGTYRGQCTEYCGAAARPHGLHGHGRRRPTPSRPGGRISSSRRPTPADARRRAGRGRVRHPLRRLPCGPRDTARAASSGPTSAI